MATDNCHDLTSLKCPLPIIRLARIVKTLTPGEECTLFADDPAFCPDVEAWCRKTGNRLIRCEDDGGRAVVVIRKGDHPPSDDGEDPAPPTQCLIELRARTADG